VFEFSTLGNCLDTILTLIIKFYAVRQNGIFVVVSPNIFLISLIFRKQLLSLHSQNAQDFRNMDINKHIVDQRIRKIVADNSDKFAGENDDKKSGQRHLYAFLLLLIWILNWKKRLD
jgi:hypothetical protein